MQFSTVARNCWSKKRLCPVMTCCIAFSMSRKEPPSAGINVELISNSSMTALFSVETISVVRVLLFFPFVRQ